MSAKRFGLPTMHKEAGERRVFLPSLIAFLDRVGAEEIVLEDGYGSSLGLDAKEYIAASKKVRFGSVEECYAQPNILVLRCPDDHIASSVS